MRQIRITQSITNRSSQSLDKYLAEVAKLPMVDAQEEIVLARKIRIGDEGALQRLINANLRFVISVAKQYQNQGLSLDDLINEGNFGLIKAAKRFDETKGFKFISYAVWWIRQTILVAIAEQARVVRLPLNQVGAITKISKAFSSLEQMYEREPTKEELAEIVQLPPEKISEALSHSRRQVSFDAPFTVGEEGSLYDLVAIDTADADKALMEESLATELGRYMADLPERMRDILILLYGIGGITPHTLEDVGEKFNLTRERVRQLRDAGLKRIRKKAEHTALKTFIVKSA